MKTYVEIKDAYQARHYIKIVEAANDLGWMRIGNYPIYLGPKMQDGYLDWHNNKRTLTIPHEIITFEQFLERQPKKEENMSTKPFAVNVTTVEQARDVLSIVNPSELAKDPGLPNRALNNYQSRTCIDGDGTYSPTEYYHYECHFDVISFEEFMKRQPIAVGDWVVCTSGAYNQFSIGKLYKVKRFSSDMIMTETDDRGSTTNGMSKCFFRKASPSEVAVGGISPVMEDKELVGYKLIKEFPGCSPVGAIEYEGDRELYRRYPEFFEPVYKARVKMFTIYPGFEVEIRHGKAFWQNEAFTKEELKGLVDNHLFYMLHGYPVDYEYVNIGCKKGIPTAKLKELISLL